jgi:hypothetical protein
MAACEALIHAEFFKGDAQQTRLRRIACSLLIGISLALAAHFMPE